MSISKDDVRVIGNPYDPPTGGGPDLDSLVPVTSLNDIADADLIVSKEGNTWYKKAASKIWDYIKSKIKSVLHVDTGTIADIVNVYGAKNLIPYPYHRASGYSSNGATTTYDEEGVLTVNKVAGSATAYFSFFSSTLYPDAELFLAPNTKYILSMELEDASDTSCFIQTVNGTDLVAIRNKETGKYEVAFTTPANVNIITLALYWAADATETNAKVKVMIRLASIQDDTYVPYAKTNSELTAIFTSSDTTDALATSWTSVTKLDSRESYSSIFAKMSQMFKNIRYLYKMLGTTDISAIGGGNVTGAIASLNSALATQEVTYSYTTDNNGSVLLYIDNNKTIRANPNYHIIDYVKMTDSNSNAVAGIPCPRGTDYLYRAISMVNGSTLGNATLNVVVGYHSKL